MWGSKNDDTYEDSGTKPRNVNFATFERASFVGQSTMQFVVRGKPFTMLAGRRWTYLLFASESTKYRIYIYKVNTRFLSVVFERS